MPMQTCYFLIHLIEQNKTKQNFLEFISQQKGTTLLQNAAKFCLNYSLKCSAASFSTIHFCKSKRGTGVICIVLQTCIVICAVCIPISCTVSSKTTQMTNIKPNKPNSYIWSSVTSITIHSNLRDLMPQHYQLLN